MADFPTVRRAASHLESWYLHVARMFGRKRRRLGVVGSRVKFAENRTRGQSRGADEVSLLIHRYPLPPSPRAISALFSRDP